MSDLKPLYQVPWRHYDQIVADRNFTSNAYYNRHPMGMLTRAYGSFAQRDPHTFDWGAVLMIRRALLSSNPVEDFREGYDLYHAVTPEGELWLLMNFPPEFRLPEAPCSSSAT